MKSIARLVVLAVVSLACYPAVAQSNPVYDKFDILGLKLGMTAKQAESILTARLHAPATPQLGGAYSFNSQNGRFVPNRKFISSLGFRTPQVTIILNFAESDPTNSAAPETLWHISYEPVLTTEADKHSFVGKLIEKYGSPSKAVSEAHLYWVVGSNTTPLYLSMAKEPILHYASSGQFTPTPELSLEDTSIVDRLDKTFNARKTTAAPPL